MQVKEHALQVDVIDPVPALLGGLDRAADFDDPNVVVQDVDPAECRDAGIDHGSDVGGERDVSRDHLAGATLPLDDPLGLEGRIGVDVGCENLRTLAGEEHRCRLAVAPARATRARS